MISKPSQTRIEWNWKSFQFSFSLKPNKGIEKNRIANEINSTFPQTKRTVKEKKKKHCETMSVREIGKFEPIYEVKVYPSEISLIIAVLQLRETLLH